MEYPRCNKESSLPEIEKEGLEGYLEQLKEIRDDKVGDVPQVGTDEGESCQSQAMSKKSDVKKLANLAKVMKATPSPLAKATKTPLKIRGFLGNERAAMKVKEIRDALLTSPKKKSPTKKSGIPIPNMGSFNLIPEEGGRTSLKGISVLLKEGERTYEGEREGKGESFDLAKGELEKKIIELIEKEKGVVEEVEVAKVSMVTEFKDFEEYSKALTLEVSRFYGEGFDLCKKQIKLYFSNLDIEIDPALAEGGAGDDNVDNDDILADPPWVIKPLREEKKRTTPGRIGSPLYGLVLVDHHSEFFYVLFIFCNSIWDVYQ
ncbi:hypothetical protein Acr_15g0008160 [Actinidia rufa]|uniref:Uncharacterized protein n=1 Tax=Actinidia rufa TaxID=165716 RepID=A0A7J0FW96_9ERIC|nr:hypothetical protein Acr_15g0008160 [Actinidia rufa]